MSTATNKAIRESPALSILGGGQIPALDGLRGVAILMVLVTHYYSTTKGLNVPDAAILSIVKTGWTGVDLFFVLSGFLITGILYDAKGCTKYFSTFYARRTLRIFPLYYGVLFVILVLIPLIRPYHSVAMTDNVKHQAWLWFYGTNIALTFLHYDFNRFHHLWSLAVEEHFYLFWPLVVFFWDRRWLIRIAWLAIGFAFLLRCAFVFNHMDPYSFTLCRMDALAMGGLVALLARGPGGLQTWLPAAKTVLAATLLGIAGIFAYYHDFFPDNSMVQTIGLSLAGGLAGSALIVVLCVSENHWISRFLTLAPLRSAGRYSYAIYVFHWILVPLLPAFIPFSKYNFDQWTHSAFLSQIPYIGASTLVYYGIALVSWHCYEKHFLKLKKYFVYHHSKKDRSRVAESPIIQSVENPSLERA